MCLLVYRPQASSGQQSGCMENEASPAAGLALHAVAASPRRRCACAVRIHLCGVATPNGQFQMLPVAAGGDAAADVHEVTVSALLQRGQPLRLLTSDRNTRLLLLYRNVQDGIHNGKRDPEQCFLGKGKLSSGWSSCFVHTCSSDLPCCLSTTCGASRGAADGPLAKRWAVPVQEQPRVGAARCAHLLLQAQRREAQQRTCTGGREYARRVLDARSSGA
jgi:hypothetical protein